MISALYSRITRRYSAFDPVVLTVGRSTPAARRTSSRIRRTSAPGRLSTDTTAALVEDLPSFVTGLGRAHGLRVEATMRTVLPATINDAAEAEFSPAPPRTCSARRSTSSSTIRTAWRTSGVLAEVPGAYGFIGAARDYDPADPPASNHSPQATFDDSVLARQAQLLATPRGAVWSRPWARGIPASEEPAFRRRDRGTGRRASPRAAIPPMDPAAQGQRKRCTACGSPRRARDRLVLGAGQHLGQRAPGQQPPLAEEHDLRAQPLQQLDVMRGDQRTDAEALDGRREALGDLPAGAGVHGGQRLIEHEDLRSGRERGREGDPLGLPTGEGAHGARKEVLAQSHRLEHLGGGDGVGAPALASLLRGELEPGAHRLARIGDGHRVLRDEAHRGPEHPSIPATQLRDAAPVPGDLPRAGAMLAAQRRQQRRLARPRGAEQSQGRVPGAQREVDPSQHLLTGISGVQEPAMRLTGWKQA